MFDNFNIPCALLRFISKYRTCNSFWQVKIVSGIHSEDFSLNFTTQSHCQFSSKWYYRSRILKLKSIDLKVRLMTFKFNQSVNLFVNSCIQYFILPRLIEWVPEIPGELSDKSKLSHRSGSATLRQLSPIHEKGP